MKLTINYLAGKSPLDEQDLRWLSYFWEISDGSQLNFSLGSVPDSIKQTIIYSHIYDRLDYYRDEEQLIEDYEIQDDDNIYMVLSLSFYSTINSISYRDYENRYNLQPKKNGGAVTINNFTNNGNISNSNLQIGASNSTQTLTINEYKSEEIKKILEIITNDLAALKANDDLKCIKDDLEIAKSELNKVNPKKFSFIKVFEGITKFIAAYPNLVKGCDLLSTNLSKLKNFIEGLS